MFRRAATFLRKRKVEQDLDDELQASVHLLAEEHIAKGVSPPSAAGERTGQPGRRARAAASVTREPRLRNRGIFEQQQR